MKFYGLPAAILALTAAAPAHAFTFPIVGRPRSEAPQQLRKRAVDMNGSFGNGSTSVSNDGDTMYSCNITLGGAEFEVLIDTGSSDLWVSGTVPTTTDLKVPASVSYAEGSASGSINTADLIFDEFTIKDQAYIKVVPSKDNPTSSGLIGLGPSIASNVRSALNGSKGDTVLDRIFRQNLTTPNFLSVLLSRVADDLPGTTPQTGQLTVGSLIPGLEAITSKTKLPALVDQFGVQHWETVLDENGIIGPDGVALVTNTTISNPTVGNAHQLHAVFDTGFTFPQVQREVADAIYGRVPGAEFVTQSSSPGYWRIPCDYQLNISFVFSGVNYPIAPLDMTYVEETDSKGNPTKCGATFQEIAPSTADHSKFGAFDMILGMAFLRNVYLLINFGDFVDGSNSSVADPYIQLLSTTDLTAAHSDFVNTRLGGQDTTASQAALLPASEGLHSPDDDSDSSTGNSIKDSVNRAKNGVESFFKKSIWIVVGAAVAGALLLGAIAFCIIRSCRRRRSTLRTESAFVPAMGSYQPLRDSHVPAGASSVVPSGAPPQYGHIGSYNSNNYGYPSQGQYTEPNYNYGGRA